MLCTYCDVSPNSDMIQNRSPTWLAPSGVRRGYTVREGRQDSVREQLSANVIH